MVKILLILGRLTPVRAAVVLAVQSSEKHFKISLNFAGQLVALFAWVAMIVAAALTNSWIPQPLFLIFGGLTLLATMLHPSGRGLFNWFSVARVHRVLLALVIVAAVPLLALASVNIGLQTAGGGGAGLFDHSPPAFHGGEVSAPSQDEPTNGANGVAMDEEAVHDRKHIALGHYRNFAALSFIVISAGILASLRPKGWRLAAWIAGGLPAILGLASIMLPDAESSLSLLWALAAIAWGIHFVVMAELIHRGIRIHPGLVDSRLNALQ